MQDHSAGGRGIHWITGIGFLSNTKLKVLLNRQMRSQGTFPNPRKCCSCDLFRKTRDSCAKSPTQTQILGRKHLFAVFCIYLPSKPFLIKWASSTVGLKLPHFALPTPCLASPVCLCGPFPRIWVEMASHSAAGGQDCVPQRWPCSLWVAAVELRLSWCLGGLIAVCHSSTPRMYWAQSSLIILNP